jgi:hypothetical protein
MGGGTPGTSADQDSSYLSKLPQDQPASTKELSEGLAWANFHFIALEPYEYMQCVKEHVEKAELFGTLISAFGVLFLTFVVRWLADAYVFPKLFSYKKMEIPPEGFFLFPSWEIKIFETVSRCFYFWCEVLGMHIYIHTSSLGA